MKSIHKLVVSACAVAGLALAGTAAQAACSSVKVTGEGLTKEIAQEVTKMNLEFAVAAKGAKAAGKAALKCGAPALDANPASSKSTMTKRLLCFGGAAFFAEEQATGPAAVPIMFLRGFCRSADPFGLPQRWFLGFGCFHVLD